ncbi:hypothetical protein J6590_082223 [Homalodisca vitripennis]|nr:hypothetical protein J6590_082223 [Homalodisca vitripennis]
MLQDISDRLFINMAFPGCAPSIPWLCPRHSRARGTSGCVEIMDTICLVFDR